MVYGKRKKWREEKVKKSSPSPIQSEMAEMSNPGVKVSRKGQFAVK